MPMTWWIEHTAICADQTAHCLRWWADTQNEDWLDCAHDWALTWLRAMEYLETGQWKDSPST